MATQISESKSNKFGSFVILDLETNNIPEYNYNKVSILEICMFGFPVSEIKKRCMKLVANAPKNGEEAANENSKIYNGEIPGTPTLHKRDNRDVCDVPPTPRTLSKLSLVVNPRAPIKMNITDLTGLDNYMLENYGSFNANTGSMLTHFISLLPQPVCLVAHNGKFDFTILKATLIKFNVELPGDVMCLDSLRAFYEIDHEIILEHERNEVKKEPEMLYEKEGESRRALNENTPKHSINLKGIELKKKRALSDDDNSTPAKCPRPETPTSSSSNNGVCKSRRALFQEDTNEDVALKRLMNSFYPPKNVYKLKNIYERVHGQILKPVHRAETDVEILMQLVLYYGEDFLNYAHTWAVPYSAIPTDVISTN